MAVKFSQKVFDKICERISQGESLSAICSDEKMPSRDSVYKWMHEDQGLTDQYARAREAQADFYVEEIIDIADKATPEEAQVARLQIDTRKWVASKFHPSKYSDRVQQEISGPNGGAIPVSVIERIIVDPENIEDADKDASVGDPSTC